MVRLGHVVVDLTPLGPNGQNGGAGLVATSLVRNFSALRPDLRLTLLTAQSSHAELLAFESDTVKCLCVQPETRAADSRASQREGLRMLAQTTLELLEPPQRARLKHAWNGLRTRRLRSRVIQLTRSDLVFCPFTAPTFHDPALPLVSIVYDLQHLAYPQFFAPEQAAYRQHHVRDACRRSDRVICISEFVHDTLAQSVPDAAPRMLTVSLGLLDRAEAESSAQVVLDRLDLNGVPFVLYPANFWQHKNHATLFEALRRYRVIHPQSALVVVCTGVPNALSGDLERLVKTILPMGAVRFPGLLPRSDLEVLMRISLALVFPSLYEGFGMPVLEAMAGGTPVLCSNVSSLPEVAGTAARYFNPTQPDEIANALTMVEDPQHAPELKEMVSRGQQRAALFGTARDMAATYLDVFDQVFAARHA